MTHSSRVPSSVKLTYPRHHSKGRIGDADELSILDFVRFMREFGQRATELSGGEALEAPAEGSARGDAEGGDRGAVAVARGQASRQAQGGADY